MAGSKYVDNMENAMLSAVTAFGGAVSWCGAASPSLAKQGLSPLKAISMQ